MELGDSFLFGIRTFSPYDLKIVEGISEFFCPSPELQVEQAEDHCDIDQWDKEIRFY